MATRATMILVATLTVLGVAASASGVALMRVSAWDGDQADALRVRCGWIGLAIAANLLALVAVSWRNRANRSPEWPASPP